MFHSKHNDSNKATQDLWLFIEINIPNSHQELIVLCIRCHNLTTFLWSNCGECLIVLVIFLLWGITVKSLYFKMQANNKLKRVHCRYFCQI